MIKSFIFYEEFIFLSSFFLLLFYLFFSKTKPFFFLSIFFFLIYVIKNFKVLTKLISSNSNSFLFLTLFILSLILSIFYSPLPFSSLDKFITTYIFNIIIFLSFSIFFKRNISNYFILNKFELIFYFFSMLTILYSIFFVISFCHSNFSCFLTLGLSMQEYIDQNKSLFIGLLNLASSLTFLFSFLLFFHLKNDVSIFKKFLSIMLAYFIFGLIIWLGRRAALLGIITGLFFVFLIFRKKILSVSIPIFLVIISLFAHSSIKERLIIRSDRIDILLAGQKEKFNEAGSLGLRLYEWDRTLKKLLENPLKGTGLGRKVAKETFYKDSLIGHPHNTFISLAIQSGVQSLIFFLAFYLCILIKIFKMTRTFHLNKTLYAFNVASFVYLIAFFVIAMFAGLEEKPGFIPFWIVSGAVLGISSYVKSLNILKP